MVTPLYSGRRFFLTAHCGRANPVFYHLRAAAGSDRCVPPRRGRSFRRLSTTPQRSADSELAELQVSIVAVSLVLEQGSLMISLG